MDKYTLYAAVFMAAIGLAMKPKEHINAALQVVLVLGAMLNIAAIFKGFPLEIVYGVNALVFAGVGLVWGTHTYNLFIKIAFLAFAVWGGILYLGV